MVTWTFLYLIEAITTFAFLRRKEQLQTSITNFNRMLQTFSRQTFAIAQRWWTMTTMEEKTYSPTELVDCVYLEM